MANTNIMFQRKSLDQITSVPEDIISVYVVENHIWADGGVDATRAQRRAELRTVDEFLIEPVRPFLNDIFRQLSAPYTPDRKDNPIGQGYWIQAEFGSGKSHLLSFIGAMALGEDSAWEIVQDKEKVAGLGRRESLYYFYENGLKKKTHDSKGIFIAVKTLVGQGGGTIGVNDTVKSMTEYVLDAVAEQFFKETGKSLPLYPTQILAERYLNTDDYVRYQRDLAKFLKDSSYFDEEEQEELSEFLDALQNNPDPGTQRDCGQRLWDFYTRYLRIKPDIPMEMEQVLKHMVERLLAEGYAGLLLILDEVSLFMKGRSDVQRIEDEKALVVLSNRLAKVENLPIWTVCAAQQAIETKMVGVKNILARERLELYPLLNKRDSYYDIALARVREITDPGAIDQYYEDYKHSFSWPQAKGLDEFRRFFPFFPPSMDVVRQISMNLTTIRSALYFMLQTLKTQRKRKSRELISLWALFDDVVEYEEDPSGTTKGITSIKTKWPDEWRAYETARHQLDSITQGPLKVYRGRCEKIVKTLFLYHVANMAPNGLNSEELMNSVMEWKDHDKGQTADLQDNKDHYQILAEKVQLELAQVDKVGQSFRFNPTGSTIDPRDHFAKARSEAESNEVTRRQAWEALLGLDSWQVMTQLMRLDLSHGTKSIFRDIAPSSQTDITIRWHGREITGRVFMRDLLDNARRNQILPSVNSSETGNDFAVFISSTPAISQLDALMQAKSDPRTIFWAPDELTPTERSLLVDFSAYRTLVGEFQGRDTQEAKEVLDWVQSRLRDQMGTIYRIVPDSYNRGRMAAADHAQMTFATAGELPGILTPLVEQVLDATYMCKEMVFDAPAPFNDTNAINVINGIVKVGEIPKGEKPNRDISAAQNYGFDLQIMKRPNDRKLDLRDCRYTQDIGEWIEVKLGASGTTMPVTTIYKNFMGIGGPEGVHYGLSKRMVQLYLLCLVREGKIRISLSGRAAPVETLDYSNVADIVFRTAILDAFDQIQRLKPPEGWALLAPYAAVLLEDEGIKTNQQDADIQSGLQRVLQYFKEELAPFQELRKGVDDLFAELEVDNSYRERLVAWERFLSTQVQSAEPIPYLLNALDQAFGYRVYRDDQVRQSEVDDLAIRRNETRQVRQFYTYRERVRAVARYARYALPDESALNEIRQVFAQAKALLEDLTALIANETRLLSTFLEPAEEAVRSYNVRYLQAFDHVSAQTEQVREQIKRLLRGETPEINILACLALVPQLGTDPRAGLQDFFRRALEGPPSLFPGNLTRAQVERALTEWPEPPGSPLTLENAAEWSARAEQAWKTCQQAVRLVFEEKFLLIQSDALRKRLDQGRSAPFIVALLETKDVDSFIELLSQYLADVPTVERASTAEPEPIQLLKRYLKHIRVRKLRLADFTPSKRTVETGDLDMIVGEFRAFLAKALEGAPDGGDDELPVVELE